MFRVLLYVFKVNILMLHHYTNLWYMWNPEGCSYRAWEVVAILELTQEEGDEEASEHEAHGQQSRIGVGWWVMWNGLVSGGFHVRVVEGVV